MLGYSLEEASFEQEDQGVDVLSDTLEDPLREDSYSNDSKMGSAGKVKSLF